MCRRLIIFRIFVFYVVIVSFDLGIFQIVDIGFNVFDFFEIGVFGDVAFEFLIVLRGYDFLRNFFDLSCLLARALRVLGSLFRAFSLRVLRRLLAGCARLLLCFRLRYFLLLSLLCGAALLRSGFLCLCRRLFSSGRCLLCRAALLGRSLLRLYGSIIL